MDGEQVFVYKGGKAKSVKVNTGLRTASQIQIVDGLKLRRYIDHFGDYAVKTKSSGSARHSDSKQITGNINMSLSSVSINRPVLATVFAIVILLFGVVGLTFLGIREFPSVDPPIISVSTSYPGANSDVIETQITEPLEQSINGIQGIRSLTSVSRQGQSDITVEFELSVDMETAANDTRDKVSQALRMLPRDCDPPVVAKADADANPILQLTVRE